ncbi:MAG: metallophosphoesterase family protein [Gaiellaceae bacterium]
MILRKRDQRFTRVFFATDLHASTRTFRKFLNAATAYKANVLVLGGDVCGKMLTPIIARENGLHELILHGERRTIGSDRDFERAVEALDTQGHYYTVLSEDEYERVAGNEAAIDELFTRLARERLAAWREEAARKLEPLGIRCFVTGGNDDRPEALAVLEEEGSSLVFCEGRVTRIDDEHAMVSCGYSNKTPWHTPREVPEEELAAIIDSACAGVDDFTNVVFNFHPPPYDSTLDLCPELDTSTDPPTPVYRGGQMSFTAAGSTAVREAIQRYQPLLGLHGHIHESRGAVNVGRSLCINPGSEYGEGYLRGCIVNLVDGKVLSYQLTSG